MIGMQLTSTAKCREHWSQLGITSTESLKSLICAIFERHTHQQDVVVDLYRLAFPDWDQIQGLTGYPQVGLELALFICSKFQEFDRHHHPNCMPGGAWLNWGFSVNRSLDPWGINLENCTPIFIPKKK